MAKHKGKDASELGGYVVFGVIVGFFLLIFYFIKLIVEEVQSIIKNNKKKERQKLREEKVVSMQEQHTEKTLEDEKSDDLNLLIQEAEEIYGAERCFQSGESVPADASADGKPEPHS